MTFRHMLQNIVGAQFRIGRQVEIRSVHARRVDELDSLTVLKQKRAFEGTVSLNDSVNSFFT